MANVTRWHFSRDTVNGGIGYSRRLSADALNALHAWTSLGSRRSFKVEQGEEAGDTVVAVLNTHAHDGTAVHDLDQLVAQHGLVHSRL